MKIGDRLRLSGGYDMYPQWLRGRTEYYARFITFLENNDERLSPVGRSSALIEFDEMIEFEGITGKYGLLDLRYSDQSWGEDPRVVHVTLLKDKINSIQERTKESSRWMESHASYEVVKDS